MLLDFYRSDVLNTIQFCIDYIISQQNTIADAISRSEDAHKQIQFDDQFN